DEGRREPPVRDRRDRDPAHDRGVARRGQLGRDGPARGGGAARRRARDRCLWRDLGARAARVRRQGAAARCADGVSPGPERRLGAGGAAASRRLGRPRVAVTGPRGVRASPQGPGRDAGVGARRSFRRPGAGAGGARGHGPPSRRARRTAVAGRGPRARNEAFDVRLSARAPGKVNLCLLVGGVRADERHELVTVLESVSLYDELSLTVLSGEGADEVVCPGVEGPNLVMAALERLRARGWDGPRVRIEIIKRIPVAGGMAGGSSDAAAALRLAEAVHPVADDVIAAVAAELGSDVPSQLVPGVWIATGAGDSVEAAR